VLHERRVKRSGGEPLLDLRLLRVRAVSTGLVAQLALACAQAAFFVYLALDLQEGRGLSPLSAGLVFTAVATGYVGRGRRRRRRPARGAPQASARDRTPLAAGLGMLAIVVSVIGVTGSVVVMLPGVALAGVGIGLAYTPTTAIIMQSAGPAHGGAASGVVATTQQLGYALSVAITGVIYFAHAANGIGHAFELSLIELSALGLVLVAATRLLPGSRRHAGREVAAATA
jgi:predicted MFS family arabinose efflux permease